MDFDRLAAMLAGYKRMTGMSDADIAAETSISQSTISRRMADPSDFRLWEFDEVLTALGVKAEERRSILC